MAQIGRSFPSHNIAKGGLLPPVASITGSGGITVKKPVASGTGSEQFTATGSARAKKGTLSGTGSIAATITGSGGISAKKAGPSGSGTIPAYNTGATTNADNVPQSTHPTLTIPASVKTGDVMIIGVDLFGFTGDTGISINISPGVAGNNWTQLDTLRTADNGSLSVHGAVFMRVATSTDPGSTLTFSYSGTPGTNQKWWDIALASYTGLASSGIEAWGTSGLLSSSSIPVPSGTASNNEWIIYVTPSAPSSSTITAGPSGTTIRQNVASSGVCCAIADSGSTTSAFTSLSGNWTAGAASGHYTSFAIGVPVIGASNTGNANAKKPSATGKGILQETFSASYVSTDASGIDTYNVTASGNGTGTHPLRVLKPTSPNAAYPHSFLYCLPVLTDQDTSYGDPLQMAHDNGWHNQYNITLISPGYAINPWYGDNATDSTALQERFTLDVVNWVQANLATSGHEKNYLIGFSKSGTGGAQLIFRNPSVFDAAALWDFPADWTDLSRWSDDTAVFGTQSNFAANYALTAANMATWVASSDFTTRNRIWLGYGSLYDTEVDDFATRLTALSAQYTYTWKVSETHAWQTDWMAAGIAAIIPSGNGQVTAKKVKLSGTGNNSAGVTGSGGIAGKKPSASGTGTEQFSGTGAPRGKKPTATGTGSETFTATGNATLKKAIPSGTGSIPGISGSGGLSLKKAVPAGTGITLWGTGGLTAKKPAATGTGNSPGPVGSGSATLKKAKPTGTGTETFSGSGGLTAKKPSITCSGAYGGAAGSGGFTLKKAQPTGTGSESFTATGQLLGKKPTLNGTGSYVGPPVSGSGGLTAKKAVQSGTGSETFTGSGSLHAKKPTDSGVGSYGSIFGSGGITAKKAKPVGTGTESYVAIGNLALKKAKPSATGTLAFVGSGGLQLHKPVPFGLSHSYGNINVGGHEIDGVAVVSSGEIHGIQVGGRQLSNVS